jgi:hypothetical protein
MQGGELFRRRTPSFLEAIRAYITNASESGLSQQIGTPMENNKVRSEEFARTTHAILEFAKLPTATVRDRLKDAPNQQGGASLGQSIRKLPTPAKTCIEPSTQRLFKLMTGETTRNIASGGEPSNLTEQIQILNIETGLGVGGKLNPPWVEWFQGFPIEWTDLQPLAMDKFQLWRNSHGKFLLGSCSNESEPIEVDEASGDIGG